MKKLIFHLLALCALILSGGEASATKIYFDNSSSNWGKVCIYYWPNGNNWPGTEMKQIPGSDIWEFDLDDAFDNVIFNNGSNNDNDKKQTGDISLTDANRNHVFTSTQDTGKTYGEYTGNNEEGNDNPTSGDVYAYADVPANWTNMYAFVYNDPVNNGEWPGQAMEYDSESGYWAYKIPDNLKGHCYVIVVSNSNKNNRYPADGEPGMELNGKSMIYHYADGENKWGVYTDVVDPPVIEPGDDIEYTIHFHNNVGWSNVYAEVSYANVSFEVNFQSFLNSVIFDSTPFTIGSNYSPKCRFYTLSGGQRQNLTEKFNVVNEHVYTISGDKGLNSKYDPNSALPEKEYWIEPANPTANDRVVLKFNRAYNASGSLKNENDIYIWAGLIKEGDDDATWTGGPDCKWEELASYKNGKFKMTKDSANPDLYYMEFSPSLAEWFEADPESSYTKLALIFRSWGGTKQHEDTQFLTLRRTVPVGEELGKVTDWEISDGRAVITSENGKIFLTPWNKDIIKVFTLRNSGLNRSERESVSVIDETTKASYHITTPEFIFSEDEENLYFAIDKGVKAGVNKATSLLSFFNADCPAASLEEATNLTNKTGNVSLAFKGMNDKGFYGGGYNGNLVNWEGNPMKMHNIQEGNWGQGGSLNRNICIPFYVSTEGYGVYFDDHTINAMVYPSKNGTSYSSRSADPIAYYYIGGGDMKSVMQNYTRLTGLQELPPYWALGYITSKFSFKSRSEAEEAVKKTKDINIPVDGIVFDIHWQTGDIEDGTHGMGKLDWATTYYPNPQEMMRNLKAQNVHTIAITEPYFTSRSGNYDFLNQNGFFSDSHVDNMGWLNSEHVGLLDITNPDAIDWFKRKYKDRTSEGVESWWLDLGEPEKHDTDSHYYDGSTYDQIHNEYGLRWNKIAFEAMKEQTPGTRFITMPRGGTSGMQRYNAFPWTGDISRSWAGLKAQVPALVSAAMSGVSYMGSDIGGFSSSGTDARLYLRWVQLGVFYPSMRTHSADRPEVWRDEYLSVRDNVRDAINLRYAYLPYTYSRAYSYTAFGTPIARPANFGDTDKSVLANEIGTYLWGEDIFVAPVLDNSTSKSITFPDGDWLDMNNFETIYQGHSHINYNAPDNTLPHFMRRGSIVPRFRQDTFKSTAEIEHNQYTVDIFMPKEGEDAYGYLYDDNHEDVNPLTDYRYLLTTFKASNSGNQSFVMTISRDGEGWEGMPETQDFLFRFHDFKINENGADVLPMEQVSFIREVKESEVATRRRESGNTMEDSSDATHPDSMLSSEQAVKDSSSDAPVYYHDKAGNVLYVRLPKVKTTEPSWLALGEHSIPTGIDNPSCLGSMGLTYGNGYLTYSAPENIDSLDITVFSAAGTVVGTYTDLKSDGYAAQVPVSLPAGVYIAKLTGRDKFGNKLSTTAKIIF